MPSLRTVLVDFQMDENEIFLIEAKLYLMTSFSFVALTNVSLGATTFFTQPLSSRLAKMTPIYITKPQFRAPKTCLPLSRKLWVITIFYII